MDEKPHVAQETPYVLEVEAGTYWWCACGKSDNQPYCDGSHKGTSFVPVKVEIATGRKVAFCGCKHTGNKPMCDGSHKQL